MRFTDPPGEAVVIDGEHVWVYTPSTTPGQVLRTAVPSGGPVYGYNMLAWLLDRPAERYEAKYLREDKVGGRAVDVVELVPAVPDLPFERAVLWLDRAGWAAAPARDHRERAVRYADADALEAAGQSSVPDSTFEFEVPSGRPRGGSVSLRRRCGPRAPAARCGELVPRSSSTACRIWAILRRPAPPLRAGPKT